MTHFVKVLLLGLLSAVALAVQAGEFDRCTEHFVNGRAPKVVREHPGMQRALCFDGFAVLHSGESKTPIFVAEHLTYQRLKNADEKRTDRFYEEARLPAAERATLADYAGSGFDRGHMAPAAEMETPNQMSQSFSLSNMVPQAPENNRGVWAKRVEAATRHYVERTYGEVYVLTGPIYQGEVQTIGRGNVWVPTKLFKLVYDPVRRKAWAHVIDNHDKAKLGKPISYAELVKMTGIDLLPGA